VSQPREIVEEYRLDEVLKMAPQSTVFQAADPDSGRIVTIKLVNPIGSEVSEKSCEHFTATMESIAGLASPAIPELVDHGFTPDGSAFMVWQHVGGQPIDTVSGIEPKVAALSQVVTALEALAELEVFHHNLSPDNLVVDVSEGGAVRASILGFGTSAYLGSEGGGALLGHSPERDGFAAPEQLDPAVGGVAQDWRSDLYSIALITAEAIGAQVDGAASKDPQVRFAEPGRSAMASPESLEAALAQALRADPHERSLSYTDLKGALECAVPGAAELAAAVPSPPEDDTAVTAPPDASPSTESGQEDEFDPNKTNPNLRPEDIVDEADDLPPLPPIPEIDHDAGIDRTVVLPPKAPSGAEPVATPPRTKKPPAAKSAPRTFTLTTVLAVAGGLILVLMMLQLLLPGPQAEPEPTPLPTAPVAVATARPPTPVPSPVIEIPPQMHPQLDLAESLLEEGDEPAVREALAGISEEDIATFSEEEMEIYQGLREVLDGLDKGKALKDLRGGLRAGSIRMLRRGVAGLSRLGDAEIASEPGLVEQLDLARRALRRHTLMWRAKKNNDLPVVIEHAAALQDLLPEYSGATKLRAEAAASIEAAAVADAGRHDYDGALSRLAELDAVWPSRPGLDELQARYVRQRDNLKRQEQILTAALERGVAGDPEEGLRRLDSVDPSSAFADRFAEARGRLETQLDEMDRQPPTVAMAAGPKLQFKKDEPAIATLRITDDFRVAKAVAMVRTESATKFVEVALVHAGGDTFRLSVAPEMHGNKGLDFFVIATDRGGREGRLGSAAEPLQIKRKRWYQLNR